MKKLPIHLIFGFSLIAGALFITFGPGEWLPKPASPQDSIPTVADEIVFSDDVKMLQEKFDSSVIERDEAQANLLALKAALVTAENEVAGKTKVVCMTQYMLADGKWSETPAYRTDELDRYEMSMKVADECLANFR